jgi:hypothetical protein
MTIMKMKIGYFHLFKCQPHNWAGADLSIANFLQLNHSHSFGITVRGQNKLKSRDVHWTASGEWCTGEDP